MKTLNFAHYGIAELTSQELIEFQGGTSSCGSNGGSSGGSLISVGDINASNLVTVNLYVAGNSAGNGTSVGSSSNGCGC